MAISTYLALITSEHNNKPNFMAWLGDTLQIPDDTQTMLSSISGAFAVDTAQGAQLDVLGQIVGANRDVGVPLASGSSILDDPHYQTYIQATIAKNNWDGTVPGLYTIWNNLFPSASLQVIDNQNMSMQVVVNNLADNIDTELVTAGLIIPRPAAVSLSVVEQTTVQTGLSGGFVVSGTDAVQLTTDTPVRETAFVSANQVTYYYVP